MPLSRQQALHTVEQQTDVLRDFGVEVSPETRNVMHGLLEALAVSGYSVTRSTGNSVDYLRDYASYMFEQLNAHPAETAPGFFQDMAYSLQNQGYDISSSSLRNAFTATLADGHPIRTEAIVDFAYRFVERNQDSQGAEPSLGP